ncbi:hypothetical protein NEOLI_000872 [Neolecta irregularis DAH-3]|uniref:Uncharacterized protein n=1 Tax=Neolecta irregularis (strain DAH-3) TaxID=1198029 RepID=A0A1U7LST6_NEOID|nr:hypothetical protein NEOLI_000872 [Neolecta irregularis DAH-3]|eukprot:OLL25689.1 hypothetical protein NEOLI_000872 [Neolecta irregularis DAH-3]
MFSPCTLFSPLVHVDSPVTSPQHQPFHIEWPSGLCLPHHSSQDSPGEPLCPSTRNRLRSLKRPLDISRARKKSLSKRPLKDQALRFPSVPASNTGRHLSDRPHTLPASRACHKTRYSHREMSLSFHHSPCFPSLVYRHTTSSRLLLDTKLKSYHKPRFKNVPSPDSSIIKTNSGSSLIVTHALQTEVVVSEVFKYFKNDTKTLGILAAVNKTWNTIANSYLFLHLNVSQWIQRPEEVQRRQASVAKAIHLDKVSREDIVHFLKLLKNIAFPRLDTLYSDDRTRALRGEHVRQLFPSSLRILKFPLETRFIASIITDQCHSLKTLHLAVLHHDNRASDHLLIDMIRVSSSSLEDISITGSGSQLSVTSTVFSVLASLPSLKILQLGCKITNLNIPEEMPRAAFQSLESLTAPFNNTAYARVMPYLRAIKHLDVSIDDGTRALEILTTFRCTTLESLRVNSREGVLLGIDIPDIAQLNPGLHTLIVGYGQPTSSFSISLTDVHMQNTVRTRPNLRVLRLQSKNMVELTDTTFDRIAEYLDKLEELELPESGLPIDLGNLNSRSHALRFPRLVELDLGPLLLNATPRIDILGFISSCTPRLKRLGRYEIGNGFLDFRS